MICKQVKLFLIYIIYIFLVIKRFSLLIFTDDNISFKSVASRIRLNQYYNDKIVYMYKLTITKFR